MKLWLILIVAGQIGVVHGPLPVNVFNCLNRTMTMNEKIMAQWERGEFEGTDITLKNTFYVCVHSKVKPVTNIEENDDDL